MLFQWDSYADEWELFSKVTFDGINKLIIVNPNEHNISVKTDIYSAWKRWVSTYDYSKFLPAIRTIGGDAVGGGLYAGDIYFLMNGWQIVVSEETNVVGTLYHDDSISPWVVLPGGGVVATVSNLAYAYNITGSSSGATPAEVWAYNNRTLTTHIPTAVENRQEMDTSSTKLSSINNRVQSLPTATDIWNQPVASMTDKTTIGGYISKMLLTIPKFLGLK